MSLVFTGNATITHNTISTNGMDIIVNENDPDDPGSRIYKIILDEMAKMYPDKAPFHDFTHIEIDGVTDR
jgi:hypothetical protein